MGLISVMSNMGSNPSNIVCALNEESTFFVLSFLMIIAMFVYIGVYLYKKDTFIALGTTFFSLFIVSIPLAIYECSAGRLLSVKYVVMFLVGTASFVALTKSTKRGE